MRHPAQIERYAEYLKSGMRLRIPHDGGRPAIVEGVPGMARPGIAVTTEDAQYLLALGRMRKLPMESEPGAIGWAQAGYDGDQADWFIFT